VVQVMQEEEEQVLQIILQDQQFHMVVEVVEV
jgi:hypothetical protein